jgi:hypothetical protein
MKHLLFLLVSGRLLLLLATGLCTLSGLPSGAKSKRIFLSADPSSPEFNRSPAASGQFYSCVLGRGQCPGKRTFLKKIYWLRLCRGCSCYARVVRIVVIRCCVVFVVLVRSKKAGAVPTS